jgi:hypothetical protein
VKYPVQNAASRGARRRRGITLRLSDRERLPSWLAMLERDQTVVHYEPESVEGFVYVPRTDSGHDIIRVPVAGAHQAR